MTNDGFAAHAWQETDGMPLNDSPEVRARCQAFKRDFAAAGQQEPG